MSTRRAVGLALAGVGVVTTIPAAMVLFRDRRRLALPLGQDNRLIGSVRFPRKGDDAY
jgi:hypothetical protein